MSPLSRLLAAALALVTVMQSAQSAIPDGLLRQSAEAEAETFRCVEEWVVWLGKSADPVDKVALAIVSQCSKFVWVQAEVYRHFVRSLNQQDDISLEDAFDLLNGSHTSAIRRELVKQRAGVASKVTMDLSKLISVFDREPVRTFEQIAQHTRNYSQNYEHWRKRMNSCGEEWVEKLARSLEPVEHVADAVASQCASTIDAAKTAFMFVNRHAPIRDRHLDEFLAAATRELVKLRSGFKSSSFEAESHGNKRRP